MTLQVPQMKLARPVATLAVMGGLALAGAVALSAGTAPVRLLGVSAQGNAVLIESTEPVAYAVSRPDPLTVVVDLRNVSVADAANDVTRRDPVAGVTLEQVAVDGKSVARIRVALARPSDYAVRSARNTIRVELTPLSPARPPVPSPLPMPLVPEPAPDAAPQPPVLADPAPVATVLERIRTRHATGVTTVTLSGNGRLTPANVTESANPRSLILEFPEVSSNAQGMGDGTLVKSVRVASSGRQPILTRVVMDLASGSTYHVARAGTNGQDLAVIFEPARSPAPVMVKLDLPAPNAVVEPEPGIPMAQAIANAAAITAGPGDPISALKAAAPARAVAAPPPTNPPSATAARVIAVPDPTPALILPAPAAVVTRQQPPAPPTPAPPVAPPVSVPPDPQQITAGQFGGPTEQQKTYAGAPMTLDFEGGDLRAILRLFSDISGLNIIIDPAVPSTAVNIVLKDLPWDQALEIILRTNQLGYEADGTVLRIAPLAVLENEQKQRTTLAAAKALAGDLQVGTFSLSYAKAGDMVPLITAAALSPRGSIQVDPRTNMLIIKDLPDRVQTARTLIGTLDRPEPQVEIEARVVTTTRDFARAIGVQWGMNGRVSPEIGNTTNLAFPNNGSLGGRLGSQGPGVTDTRANPNNNAGTVVNLPALGAVNTAIGLALGSVNGAFNLDVALSALERTGKGRILSTPRVTTQNNIEAEIKQGVELPVVTPATNTSPATVSYRDAVLSLRVLPQITSANTVIMQIFIENNTPGVVIQNNPSIDKQSASTRVQVSDGMTTILGGIFVASEQRTLDRTPVLHRIPLLGWLFKRESDTDESRELLIFITPRILRS